MSHNKESAPARSVPVQDPFARATSRGKRKIPVGGYAALIPEISVTRLEESVRFWCGLLGFEIAYERAAARFAFLARGAAQVMLCERNGRWEPAEMQRPFGRGVNLQITVERIEPMLTAIKAGGWALYEEPNDVWYGTGDREIGQREFLVQDPDGYLLRFAESIGTRAAPQSDK